MKRVLVVAMACSAVAAWGQAPTKKMSSFEELDAAGIGIGYKPPVQTNAAPEPPKRTLGRIDKWRYESCQTDAAKAPTSQGVAHGMRVCREKFGQ